MSREPRRRVSCVRRHAVAALLALGASLAVGAGTSGQAPAPAPAGGASAADVRTVADRYCVTCHNARLKSGGFVFADLDPSAIARDPAAWEKVVRKVRAGMMPPAAAPRPERAMLDRFALQVETALDREATARPNPGAPALHRLNRTEYANAIRDLLDLPVDAAALLPGDDSAEGFDNMASVLSVSPALMQAYVSAAARISRLAVGDMTTAPSITTYTAPRGLSQADHREGMPLGTRGGIEVLHVFPLDATYELRIGRSGGGFGLPAVGGDDAVEVTLDGERLRLFEKAPPRDLAVTLPAGPHRLGVALVRQRNARGVDDLFAEHATSVGIQSVSINGPLKPAGPGDTPSRRRLFVCRPSQAAEEDACARRILAQLATRAYRRPVAERSRDVETLLEFYEKGRALRGFDTGIQYALARVLADPQFVFRFEREPAQVAPGGVYRVDDLALASRLSFFLWSSLPDDELLRIAAAGRLHEPAVLEQQTRRLLRDPRAQALVDNFGAQWLMLRQLDAATPGTKAFDGNLRYSFMRETQLLFETILREDRSLLDLIDADFTFVDERLARHYGIPNVRGSRFRRVALQGDARRGLLGHGSLLTVTSAGNRTSPVKRGKWVLEHLLGAPVPAPPPGVEVNLEKTAGGATGPTSLRQRMEQHRANASCASCHALMDPVGFALENFDLIGGWRDTDGGVPVNATGRLADGTALDGPASVRRALVDRREAVVTTATEKLLTYALGRRLEAFDMPAVRGVVRQAAGDRFSLSSLVVGVVKSVPFQMKRKEGSVVP